jgi:hypothetical protein
MKSSTLRVILMMLAIITFALFVHYLVYPKVSEAFQEGATANSSSGAKTTYEKNITRYAGQLGKKNYKVQDPKTKKMINVTEHIKNRVAGLSKDARNKIIKKGNIQYDKKDTKCPSNNPANQLMCEIAGLVPKGKSDDVTTAKNLAEDHLKLLDITGK